MAQFKGGFMGDAGKRTAADISEATYDAKTSNNPKHKHTKPPEDHIDRSQGVPRIKNVRKMLAENPRARVTLLNMSVEKHPDRDEYRLVDREMGQAVRDQHIPAEHRAGFKDCDDDSEDSWRPIVVNHRGKQKRIKRATKRSVDAAFESAVPAEVDAEVQALEGRRAPLPDGLPVDKKELGNDLRLLVYGNGRERTGFVLVNLRTGKRVRVDQDDIRKVQQRIADRYQAELDKVQGELVDDPNAER